MAKNREGKLPSAIDADNTNQYNDISEKYSTDANEPAPGVYMRHPNRNTGKDEDKKEHAHRSPQAVKSINQPFSEERSNAEAEELPGILYKSLFEQLANYRADCCISAYLPTHRSGMEVNEQQDRIAFKNTLQQVRLLLQEKGLSHTQIE